MADELPTVESSGILKIGELELTVLHLSNGKRVIPSEDMERFFAWLEGGDPEMKNVTPDG